MGNIFWYSRYRHFLYCHTPPGRIIPLEPSVLEFLWPRIILPPARDGRAYDSDTERALFKFSFLTGTLTKGQEREFKRDILIEAKLYEVLIAALHRKEVSLSVLAAHVDRSSDASQEFAEKLADLAYPICQIGDRMDHELVQTPSGDHVFRVEIKKPVSLLQRLTGSAPAKDTLFNCSVSDILSVSAGPEEMTLHLRGGKKWKIGSGYCSEVIEAKGG